MQRFARPLSRLRPPFGLVLIALAWCLASGPATARTLQQVLNEGSLRVGLALATPWVARTPDGDLTGFEVDVAKQLAQDMGVAVEFRVFAWDRLIRALEAGEIDLIASGLTITPERALHVNFSQPYAESGVALALHRSQAGGISDLTALDAANRRVAVVSGSVAAELLRRALPRATEVGFETPEAASAALLAAEVDALLAEEPVPTFLALQHPEAIVTPLAQALLRSPIGFAINKGDPDFLAFLNAWITARRADTWLPTIHAYWFESLHWRSSVAGGTP